MDKSADDVYLPMGDSESYSGKKQSFASKTWGFMKKFLLFIITLALLLFLILQFILISGGKSIKDEWNQYHVQAQTSDSDAAAVIDYSDYEYPSDIAEEATIATAEAAATITEAAVEGAAVIEAGVQEAAANL